MDPAEDAPMIETDDEDDGAMATSPRADQPGPPASCQVGMDVCEVKAGAAASEPTRPTPDEPRKGPDEAVSEQMEQPADAGAGRPAKEAAGAEAPSEAASERLTEEVAIGIAQEPVRGRRR